MSCMYPAYPNPYPNLTRNAYQCEPQTRPSLVSESVTGSLSESQSEYMKQTYTTNLYWHFFLHVPDYRPRSIWLPTM